MREKNRVRALDRAGLRELALTHLARFATTEFGLARVLERHIERRARRETMAAHELEREIADAKEAAREVIAELAASGAVDDASFAAARAKRLTRTGRSRRVIAAHLAARGVSGATIAVAFAETEQTELAAALVFARRRRLGPFRAGPGDGDVRQKELAILARAGFPQTVAVQVLSMSAEEAEPLIAAMRRG
jgi:regulatory protein